MPNAKHSCWGVRIISPKPEPDRTCPSHSAAAMAFWCHFMPVTFWMCQFDREMKFIVASIDVESHFTASGQQARAGER